MLCINADAPNLELKVSSVVEVLSGFSTHYVPEKFSNFSFPELAVLQSLEKCKNSKKVCNFRLMLMWSFKNLEEQ